MEFYGTIGPSCNDIETLRKMFQVGMTGVRLNLSHTSLEESSIWIRNIHKAAQAEGVCAALLIDLQGPELRVGKFQFHEEYLLKEGKRICLGTEGAEDIIPIPPTIFSYLKCGQNLLLDDGNILLEVVETEEENCLCTILRGGVLKPGKSIAISGVEIESNTLTKMDYRNIRSAKEFGVTGVMLPFVRGNGDVRNLKRALEEAGETNIPIYAKIENMTGVHALEEIIPETDVVVIARGDLGNSMPLWELPRVQKDISQKCRNKNRAFMVVTQMLTSMEHAKIPTRAEVSDIFNAVLDGASSVMLTGETAVGEYPVEAMEYLVKTAKAALLFKRF